jgi:hypothetical protein
MFSVLSMERNNINLTTKREEKLVWKENKNLHKRISRLSNKVIVKVIYK